MTGPSPLNPAGNGRTPQGRFAPGNRAGRGNPLNRKAQALRNALLRAVSMQDLREVTKALLAKAKSGDVPAVRELLDRLFGKAPQAVALTDGDGESLGTPALTAAVLQALDGFPDEVKVVVAANLRALANGPGSH